MPSPSVLKLIYPNAVFGPIELEYTGPLIRVGRSEDNDLVLRHPSVQAHHCILVFRGEKLVWLAPDEPVSAESDLRNVAGPEFGAGDPLQIGDLLFTLARSSQAVAIPAVQLSASNAAALVNLAARDQASQKRYFCPHCRGVYQKAELKQVGLVGHAKRWLCPKCSHVFEVEPELASRQAVTARA